MRSAFNWIRNLTKEKMHHPSSQGLIVKIQSFVTISICLFLLEFQTFLELKWRQTDGLISRVEQQLTLDGFYTISMKRQRGKMTIPLWPNFGNKNVQHLKTCQPICNPNFRIPVVSFINILCVTFTLVDSEIVKRLTTWLVIFTHSGSTCVKEPECSN